MNFTNTKDEDVILVTYGPVTHNQATLATKISAGAQALVRLSNNTDTIQRKGTKNHIAKGCASCRAAIWHLQDIICHRCYSAWRPSFALRGTVE